MLLDPLDCVSDPEAPLEGGSEASLNDALWVMETAPDIVCFEPTHLVLAMACTISMGVYTMLVLRLIRVGGNLTSVEFSPLQYAF